MSQRIRQLNECQNKSINGPILYWMYRDQRFYHNWAIHEGIKLAKKHDQPFGIVVAIRKDLIDYSGTKRMFNFMIEGLKELEQTAQKHEIAFFFETQDPTEAVPKLVSQYKVSALISDFTPIKVVKHWKRQLVQKLEIPFYEVDSHNIVPCWTASPKQEFAARTFRPKVQSKLDEYLTEFPKLPAVNQSWKSPEINWTKIESEIQVDDSVPITQFPSGEKAAEGKMGIFLQHYLKEYATKRNDPSLNHLSHLSPYLHFGQLSAQTLALAVERSKAPSVDKEAFLEELIVRRELADNYCYYNSDYDQVKGFPQWAQQTLDDHRADEREYVYSKEELEGSQTHDPAWNTAQTEMVKSGKMHGYMRMYWAKKILEWTKTPEQAMKFAIYLNDKYSLDGRDPNGYVGIAWSIGGVHDRGWTEREIFGKIRYMNDKGLHRKFDVQAYIDRVNSLGK